MRNLPPPRLRPQPDLARALADRPTPVDVDEADLPERRTRDRRAQTPSPAAAADCRQARATRTTHPPQARSRLALVRDARGRVPAPPNDPGALLNTHRTRGHDPDSRLAAPTIFSCLETDHRKRQRRLPQLPSRPLQPRRAPSPNHHTITTDSPPPPRAGRRCAVSDSCIAAITPQIRTTSSARTEQPLREEPVTTREQEVVKLIAERYNTERIAETLVISEKTVERAAANHVREARHARRSPVACVSGIGASPPAES